MQQASYRASARFKKQTSYINLQCVSEYISLYKKPAASLLNFNMQQHTWKVVTKLAMSMASDTIDS